MKHKTMLIDYEKHLRKNIDFTGKKNKKKIRFTVNILLLQFTAFDN